MGWGFVGYEGCGLLCYRVEVGGYGLFLVRVEVVVVREALLELLFFTILLAYANRSP